MAGVTSRAIGAKGEAEESRNIVDRAAPLPRAWIDDALPVMRALVGALFVAFSAYATVTLFGGDIRLVVGNASTVGVFADRYWFGVLLAFGLFIGEILTAEHAPTIYWALLIPDTFYTARQMQVGFLSLLTTYQAIGMGLMAGVTIWGLLLAGGKSGRTALIFGVLTGLTLWYIIGIIQVPPWLWSSLAWLFAGLNGYLIARFGETLLFGRRRRE
jgi:hypothetical protein